VSVRIFRGDREAKDPLPHPQMPVSNYFQMMPQNIWWEMILSPEDIWCWLSGSHGTAPASMSPWVQNPSTRPRPQDICLNPLVELDPLI
jgi:hypothetical protein